MAIGNLSPWNSAIVQQAFGSGVPAAGSPPLLTLQQQAALNAMLGQAPGGNVGTRARPGPLMRGPALPGVDSLRARGAAAPPPASRVGGLMRGPAGPSLPAMGYEGRRAAFGPNPSRAAQGGRGVGGLFRGPAGPSLPSAGAGPVPPSASVGGLFRGPAGPSLPSTGTTMLGAGVGIPNVGPASAFTPGAGRPPLSMVSAPAPPAPGAAYSAFYPNAPRGLPQGAGVGSVFQPWVPRSLTDRLPEGRARRWGGRGAGTLGNMGAYIGATLLDQGVRDNNVFGGEATPQGRMARQLTGGMQRGALFGPAAGVGNMAFSGVGQLGMEAPPVGEMFTEQNPASATSMFLSSNPITAPVFWAGKGLSNLTSETGFNEGIADLASKVPVVGGFMSSLFNPSGESSEAEAEAAALPDPREYPRRLTDAMNSMGISPLMQNTLRQKFNEQIEWARQHPNLTLELPVKNGDVTEMQQVKVTPEEYAAHLFEDTYNSLSAVREQEQSEGEFARRNAVMQAALMEQIPQFTQPFYEQSAAGQDTLGQFVTGSSPAVADAMRSYSEAQRAGFGRMGDAVARELASIPAGLAMDRQMAWRNSYDAQVENAEMARILAQNRPDLFGQQGGGASGDMNEILAQALLGGGG